MRERSKGGKTKNLVGSLLLAHPALRDANFRHTVILMSAHGSEGAMGVVLNRPVGRRLGELNGDFSLGPLASVPVYHGGPVQTEQLILAAWQAHADGFKLYFGIEPEKAEQLASEEGTHLRAFLGYSGWIRRTAGTRTQERHLGDCARAARSDEPFPGRRLVAGCVRRTQP